MNCPGSTEDGCRCPQHHPGLLEFSPDPAALEQLLAYYREPVTLSVVTMPPDLDDTVRCDGSMVCQCPSCEKERASRRAVPIRQPWDPKPARRAA